MDKLILALIPLLCQVESGGNPGAVGDNGAAVGVLQIHTICVDDVNRISGLNYTYQDRYDAQKSREMAVIYLTHYGRAYSKKTGQAANMEVLAAMWCSGPTGYKKMDRPGVKKYIEKVRKVAESKESR